MSAPRRASALSNRLHAGRALWALALGALLLGCEERSSAPRASSSPGSAAPTSAGAPRAELPGIDRLEAAMRAASPKVAPPAELQPTVVTEHAAADLCFVDGDLYAVLFGEQGEAAFVARVGAGAAVEPLGAAPEPRALLPAPGGGVVAASKLGLTWHRPGHQAVVLRAGAVRAAVRVEQRILFAQCRAEMGEDCEVGLLEQTDEGGAPRVTLGGARLAVVHGLTWWRDQLYVAGRQRDPREGIPLSPGELEEQARFLTQGGAVPRSARYAPGWLAVLSPGPTANTQYWPFPQQRPIDVLSHGGELWLLTEGTLARGLSDAVLARISAGGQWRVVATGLELPEGLRAAGHRVCWREMPGAKFTISCFDTHTQSVQVMVNQDWNVLDFALGEDTIAWSSLTRGGQGVRRAPLGS